jgi:hypothetical protein
VVGVAVGGAVGGAGGATRREDDERFPAGGADADTDEEGVCE